MSDARDGFVQQKKKDPTNKKARMDEERAI